MGAAGAASSAHGRCFLALARLPGRRRTITDANLLLGRLDPAFFLGGRLERKPELSGQAMRTLADTLGHDEVEVASSMIRIANESMANAIRIVTVEQGIDPRDFAIVAMGGAGPTHACGIAESIGIDRVIVPPHPGVTSAFGALAAPVRVDEVRSVALTSGALDVAALAAMVDELEATAQRSFAAQSPGGESPRVERAIAMRYQGQNYEQEVALPDGALDAAALERTFERYHELHHEFYGYRFDGAPIELVRIAVAVAGPDAELPPLRAQAAAGRAQRPRRRRLLRRRRLPADRRDPADRGRRGDAQRPGDRRVDRHDGRRAARAGRCARCPAA